jgi:hypothetical protein
MWKANLNSTVKSFFRPNQRKSLTTPNENNSNFSTSETAVTDTVDEKKPERNEGEDIPEREEEKKEKSYPALKSLPAIGSSRAHRKGSKHGLTPIQVDRKIMDLTECIKRGGRPIKCKSCHNVQAYMYHSFYKRGGRKSLYCCAECFDHWSDFYCEEEDYDFLSG